MKRSRFDHPTVWGGVTYSHSKVVCASFSVAWTIARAKASHTTAENLIKLGVKIVRKWPGYCLGNRELGVKMAKIFSGNAVADKLAMVPLSNNTNKQRIQEL